MVVWVGERCFLKERRRKGEHWRWGMRKRMGRKRKGWRGERVGGKERE